MSKVILVSVVSVLLLAGCESLRFAPGESQKQNAWLHEQTARMAADVAQLEDSSGELQGLTKLCEVQSRAFTADYGLPDQFPAADSAEAILAQSNQQIAQTALAEARKRPDAWDLADGAMELGIGIAALFGGVYGVRAARFLSEARVKSKALREIIEGNELFKRTCADSEQAFKQAHKDQSPQTRRLVTQFKNA
ncbi:MAG TPA: hypothetical protein HPP87_11105 [Planctomycetes bacterium]|nr:hypothetical protein [Planctomycetota bacterium]